MAALIVPATKGHRWFAATYDSIMRGGRATVLGELRPLIVGAAAGRILEIGAGTGASFPYYNREAVEKIVATGPDPHGRSGARRWG